MDSVDDVKTAYPDLSSEEITLVKKLSEFPAAVNRALEENEPSVIARYTLALCSDFNQFYHNCPILRSEGAARAFRLKLTKCVRKVLGVSLDLLGMKRTEEI